MDRTFPFYARGGIQMHESNNCQFLALIVVLLWLSLLFIFIYKTWAIAKKKEKKEEKEEIKATNIQMHNERIYKDFEFFMKVTIAILTGIGLIKFNFVRLPLAGKAITFLAFLELLAMTMAIISISTHQASKFTRWKNVEIEEFWQWQEPWMMVIIAIVGFGIWIVAWVW
jgi:Na+-transporting methylmalonyl-CoA/oxaloacetate decarboxylase gamma subunit